MTLAHFPADRRTADVRRCAQALLTIHGEKANTYWRSEMQAIAVELTRQGAAPEEVSRQAALFMNAVQLELQRLFAEDEEQAVDARA